MLRTTQSRSISELYDRCTYDQWLSLCEYANYHDILKTGLELYIKYKLDLQREDMWEYAIAEARRAPYEPNQVQEFYQILIHNNITDYKQFALNIKMILNKEVFKVNSLRFYGVPNSCKSLLANCIVEPFICCFMNNHGSENEFYLSNMLNKSVILCEELYITIATAEDFKSVLGGQPIDVAKKFNEKQLLQRTPTIITSNYQKFGRGHLPPLDEAALAGRCVTYRFNVDYKPKCTLTFNQFYYFLLDCINKY